MPEDFTIRWEINDISQLTFVPRVSPTVRHFNIPWRLLVQKENSNRTKNKDHMGLFLCCNHESTCELWSCEQSSQLIVCNRKKENNLTKSIECTYHGKGMTNWGWPSHIEFATLLRPSEGFVKNNKVIVEARVSVTKLQFISRDFTELDFTQPTLSADNISLELKDGIVNVCRRYMMWHSPYFALKFGKANEEETSEIQLKNIPATDFIQLLDVIYPSQKPISYDSYKPILKLGKLFQIERALDLVEKYLITATLITTSEKLFIAEEYNLESLKAHCFESIKSLNDMKKLEVDTDFSRLSAALKASLLNQAFEMIQ